MYMVEHKVNSTIYFSWYNSFIFLIFYPSFIYLFIYFDKTVNYSIGQPTFVQYRAFCGKGPSLTLFGPTDGVGWQNSEKKVA